jgi:thiol-disulfide isomerase/thioredoxin
MQAAAMRCGTVISAALAAFSLATTHSQAQPANDAFANRIQLVGSNAVASGSSVGATWENGEPYHAGNAGGASVWWSWTAPADGGVTISTAGSSFDTLVGLYTGSSVSALTFVGSNDDEDRAAAIYNSKLVVNVLAGQTYAIAVDGYGGAAGSVQLSVKLGPPVPPPSAPAWATVDPFGAAVASSNYAGKVVIFNFWATWCGPCLAEMPDFVALQEKYRRDGLVIVGANVSDTAQTVQSFLSSWTPAINYPMVMANSAMAQAFGYTGSIPTTFIIDRQNGLRKKYIGSQSRTTFENQIIPLLYSDTRLAFLRSGNQMTLRWPTNAINFTLQSATSPTNPVWVNWPTTPTVVNGSNTVQVTTTGAPRYFRLRMP